MLLVHGQSLARKFGRRDLFANLDLSFQTGEVLGVTGGNGSGKSTLSMILLGQLRPSKGSMQWQLDGRALSYDERRAVSWIVAPYSHWYEPLTADENLRFLTEVTGRTFDGRAVQSALDQVGLGGRGSDLVRTYSSGMKQRLKIAAIEILRPALLILDEPGSTLDQDGHALIKSRLSSWREFAAIALATNDEREVALSDRQIHLLSSTAHEFRGKG